MRVSLPVHPRLKTISELATIEYIRHYTDIPAPQILGFDSSNNNEHKLGFEWILMERVSGGPFSDRWLQASWLKKEVLVRKTMAYLVQLFGKRFTSMGNIYATNYLQQLPTAQIPKTTLLGPEFRCSDTGICLSEMVSVPFFSGKHLEAKVERGPFRNSRDWLAARLHLHIYDIDNAPEPNSDSSDGGDDEDDEYAHLTSPEVTKRRAERLLALLPVVFPEEHEEFVLHHHDLNSSNIMVDTSYKLTGIIDWECITTCPLWLACQVPKFIDDVPRLNCPDPRRYSHKLLPDGTEDPDCLLYEHNEQYEKTCMREFFFRDMRRICPEWIQVYEASKLKRDFEDAVSFFGFSMMSKDIEDWVTAVENGESPNGVGEHSPAHLD
jgi:hypothetical protein